MLIFLLFWGISKPQSNTCHHKIHLNRSISEDRRPTQKERLLYIPNKDIQNRARPRGNGRARENVLRMDKLMKFQSQRQRATLGPNRAKDSGGIRARDWAGATSCSGNGTQEARE